MLLHAPSPPAEGSLVTTCVGNDCIIPTIGNGTSSWADLKQSQWKPRELGTMGHQPYDISPATATSSFSGHSSRARNASNMPLLFFIQMLLHAPSPPAEGSLVTTCVGNDCIIPTIGNGTSSWADLKQSQWKPRELGTMGHQPYDISPATATSSFSGHSSRARNASNMPLLFFIQMLLHAPSPPAEGSLVTTCVGNDCIIPTIGNGTSSWADLKQSQWKPRELGTMGHQPYDISPATATSSFTRRKVRLLLFVEAADASCDLKCLCRLKNRRTVERPTVESDDSENHAEDNDTPGQSQATGATRAARAATPQSQSCDNTDGGNADAGHRACVDTAAAMDSAAESEDETGNKLSSSEDSPDPSSSEDSSDPSSSDSEDESDAPTSPKPGS
ncbi:dentin sialophosphoprotein-like isoform X2 [Ixodes scapularis]